MKCRYFCRLPLDISPVYLTRGISNNREAAELITTNDEKLIEHVSHHFTLLFCQKHHNIIASLNECCHLFRT